MLEIAGKRQVNQPAGKSGRIIRVATGSVLLSLLLSLLLVLCNSKLATAEQNLLVRIDRRTGEEPAYGEAAGRVLRYCAETCAVLEISEAGIEDLRTQGLSFVVIDTVRAGTRFWLLYPRESYLDSLRAYGRLFALDNRGLYVLGLDETLESRLVPFVDSQMPLPEKAECGARVRRSLAPLLGPGTRIAGLSALDREKFLSSISSQVSQDSIEAIVHFLNFDYDSGKYRSRYTFFRADTLICRNDSLAIPAWLMQKLEGYIGGRGAASLDSFVFRYGGSYYTGYNVVGRIPGGLPGSGSMVLCAHYDATAGRTPSWHWCTDPAPGADDNASGVASVLECARILSQSEFDFDIEFVLFAAEEQGLFGSNAYAQAKKNQGANILGALNFDMVAYRTVADSTFLRTNPFSEWLLDHISDVSETLFDSIGLRVGPVPVPGPFDASDHSSFWLFGFDAVHFFEVGSFPLTNPYYHTVNDTAGTLNYSLALKVTQLGAASIAYFSNATRPWDISVVPGDLEFRLEGKTAIISGANVGDVVSITPAFHNLGAGLYDTTSVYVSVYDGEPSSGTLVGQRLVRGVLPSGGGPVIEPVTWLLTDGEVGAHTVYLFVDAGDAELNTANNITSKTFRVASTQLAIKHSFVFPNPSRVSLNDMKLRVFVTRDAMVTSVDVYDVSGRRIGGCGNGECGQIDLSAGDNDISMNEVLPLSEVSSGVYVYRLSIEDENRKEVCSGRFAVVR